MIIAMMLCAVDGSRMAFAQTVTAPPANVPSDDKSSDDELLADICLVGASPDYTWRPRLIYEIGTTIPSSGVQRRRVFGDNDLHLGVSSDGTITVNAPIRRERFEGDPMTWPLIELAHYDLVFRQQMSDGPTVSSAPTDRERDIGRAINERLYPIRWYQSGHWAYDTFFPGGYFDQVTIAFSGFNKTGVVSNPWSSMAAPPPRLYPVIAPTISNQRPNPKLYSGGIRNGSTPLKYNRTETMFEPPSIRRWSFIAEGIVGGNRQLELRFWLRYGPHRSQMRGREEYDRIVEHFKGRFDTILDRWQGNNLAEVNLWTRHGLPLEVAVRLTWSAQQAFRHGYNKVSIESGSLVGSPGHYRQILVRFSRGE